MKSNLQQEAKMSDKIQVLAPRKLNIFISEGDMVQVQDSTKKHGIKSFIEEYKIEHPSLSSFDTESLILIGAVKVFDIFLFNKILRVMQEDGATNSGVLVTLDGNDQSVILCALEKSSCIPQLQAYVFDLVQSGKIQEKYVLESSMLERVAYALKHLKTETHPKTIIEDLIKPIYTEESVKELIEVTGEDWLDSYYV